MSFSRWFAIQGTIPKFTKVLVLSTALLYRVLLVACIGIKLLVIDDGVNRSIIEPGIQTSAY